MNSRQQRADFLAREIARLGGAWCVSPLPLDDSAKLKVQILDSESDRVVTALCEMGFLPARAHTHYRVTAGGLVPASLYEIDLPRERQAVPDRIRGEIAGHGKTDAELEAMKKAMGVAR